MMTPKRVLRCLLCFLLIAFYVAPIFSCDGSETKSSLPEMEDNDGILLDDDIDDDVNDDFVHDDDSDIDDDIDNDSGNDDIDDDTGDDDDLQPGFEAGYEYFLLEGEPAPPNPVTGAQTPPKFNTIPLFRFRLAEDIAQGVEPRPVQAVIILMPGFIAGASQMFHLARNIVSLSEGRIEVWIPDRRHSLLEDQLGMDTAVAQNDPWIAYDYYFNGSEIEGRTFQEINAFGPETDMMSEWGLDLQMHDIRRIVHLVPEMSRQNNVFLGGDSRGVAFTQAFAAYEFEDGRLGSEDLAGLILWDGGVRDTPWFNESWYVDDILRLQIRLLPRTVNTSSSDFFFLEVFGMVVTEGMGDPYDPALGPNGFFPDHGAFQMFYPLLTRFHNVTLTNEAFMGLYMDSGSMPYPSYMGHMGRLTGGEIDRDIFGEFPSENGAEYSWLRWDECDPPELMNIQNMAKMLYEGPSNFSDPYYSYRLDLDMAAADFFETEGTWRHNYFHFYTSRVDVPVFAMSSLLFADTPHMSNYRSQIAPVRGQDRPRSEIGFTWIVKNEWSHLDSILMEPVNDDVLPNLVDWVDRWAQGEARVPAFE